MQSRELTEAARDLEDAAPQAVLAWALARYSPRITLACSFGGPTGMVALDMVMEIDRTIPVYYLDTGLLFEQTYALVARVRERYGIDPIGVRSALTVEAQASEYGDALWSRDPDACCNLRKVLPQRDYLKGYDAWISGLRRDQSATRKQTPVVQWDAQFGLVKINPFVSWDERMIWTYIRAHDLPYNELHEAGYPSVGCIPCTRAVKPGEDARAGRWSGFTKTECGLHVSLSSLLGERQHAR
jgi:phosphoadenosine phosphosulfate reductase